MVTYVGSLVQLRCVEGEILQTNIAGVSGAYLQCVDHTGFVPAQGGLCFPGLHHPGSRLLCRDPVQSRLCISCTSRVEAPQVLGYSARAQTCILCPSQVRAAQETRCLVNALSQVGCASSSPPWSQPLSFLGVPRERCLRCSVHLLWGADLRLPHSWQMSTIQDPRKTWLETGSLLVVRCRMPSWFRGEVAGAPCPLALAVACLPLCLGSGGGPCTQPATSPFVFARSFVLFAGQAAC